MIPIRDDIPSQRVSLANYALIAACGVIFLAQLLARDHGRALVERFGLVTMRVAHGNEAYEVRERVVVETPAGPRVGERDRVLPPTTIPPLWTLVTCLFLHGGWLHFLGNMWFLVVFGDNVEDRFGHVGFVLVYCLSGLAAGLLALFAAGESLTPVIGSSGAIAGVMGAYLVMYPHARIVTITPLGGFAARKLVPVWWFVVLWFALQLLVAAFGRVGSPRVAWWAHGGGFVAGLSLTWLLFNFGWLRRNWGESALPEPGYF